MLGRIPMLVSTKHTPSGIYVYYTEAYMLLRLPSQEICEQSLPLTWPMTMYCAHVESAYRCKVRTLI